MDDQKYVNVEVPEGLVEGMLVAVTGIVAGVSIALVSSRVLSTLLYGVPARDPITDAAVAIALGPVVLAACFLPANGCCRDAPA